MTDSDIQQRRINASLLITRINIAVGTLQTRKAGIAQAHDERIKRLSRVRDRLQAFFISPDTINGLGEISIDPDVKQLIDNPESGL